MSRAIALFFGVFGYLVFIGTFLYVIGFVGSILMPKSAAAEFWSVGSNDRSDLYDDRRGLAQRQTSPGFKAPITPDPAKRVCIVRAACVNTPLDEGDCLEC